MRMSHDVDPLVLKNYIKETGLKPKENTVSFIFTCPRCSHKDKLYIRKRNGQFVCFYCREIDGFQGRVEYALSALLDISVSQVQANLYGSGPVPATAQIDVYLIDFFGEEDVPEDIDEPPVIQWPVDFLPLDHHHAVRGVSYLAGRGVPQHVAMAYGARYSPMQRRVAFPVALGDRLYGYQARLIVPNKGTTSDGHAFEVPKVLSSKSIPRGMVMFGNRLQDSECAVVCEGPIDAIKAHEVGGNVCTMGKAVTPSQIRCIQESGVRKVYLALDPDAAEETQRLVREFYSDCEVHYVEVPSRNDGKKADLGELSIGEAKDLILGSPRVTPGHIFVFLE